MKMYWMLVAAIVALLTPPGLAQERPAQAAAATAPKGNAEQGKKLYVGYGCYQCHGYEAQGSSATGPRLGPRPLPFASFSRYVRNPSNQMPPYTTKVVSDAELADIYAYVDSRPAPKAIPLN